MTRHNPTHATAPCGGLAFGGERAWAPGRRPSLPVKLPVIPAHAAS
jgi:hypothetical protein